MAKYKVAHACGHTSEKVLYGPGAERERKIEWFESNDCPQCWGKKKREREELLPISAEIRLTLEGEVEIALTGGTLTKKEEIKSKGYAWGNIVGGMESFLNFSLPKKGWIKTLPFESFKEKSQEFDKELKEINAKIVNKITPLDLEAAKERIKKESEKEKKIKELKKPSPPACRGRGRWNGKIYGKAGRYSIYLDGEVKELKDSEAEMLQKYSDDFDEYIRNKKQILNEV